MAEESSKNYRDFFSVIFIPHTDLGHHPQDGIEGHKREGSKTQIYVSSFFVCLKVGQKKKILLLTNFWWSATLDAHILFCSVNPHGMKVVFCLPFPLTSRPGLKPMVASAPFFPCPGLFCGLGFFHHCLGLSYSFPFDC